MNSGLTCSKTPCILSRAVLGTEVTLEVVDRGYFGGDTLCQGSDLALALHSPASLQGSGELDEEQWDYDRCVVCCGYV